MAGIGDVSGRAVRLNFGRLDRPGQQTGTPQGVVGRRAGGGARAASQSNFDDVLPRPEGIQLDQAGIYQETYKAYGALRSFLAEARASGIDPLQGPDPNIPESYQVVNEWNRALSTYYQMLERGQQGLENLNAVTKAVSEGNAFASQAITGGETGILSQEERMTNTIAADPNWLTRDVALLKGEPGSEADYTARVNYRNQRIEAMQQQVEDGSMSEQQFQYYLSKLPEPAKYTAPPVKPSSGGSGGGRGSGGTVFQPRVEELVTLMNTVKSGGQIDLSMIKSLGRNYQGDDDVPLVSVRAVDGDLELTFQRKVSAAQKKDINNRIVEINDQLRTVAKESVNPELNASLKDELAQLQSELQDETFSEYVTEENVFNALKFFLSDAQFQGIVDDMRKAGVKPGQETLTALNRIFGFDGPGRPGGSSGQSKTIPGFEDEKKEDPEPPVKEESPLDP